MIEFVGKNPDKWPLHLSRHKKPNIQYLYFSIFSNNIIISIQYVIEMMMRCNYFNSTRIKQQYRGKEEVLRLISF